MGISNYTQGPGGSRSNKYQASKLAGRWASWLAKWLASTLAGTRAERLASRRVGGRGRQGGGDIGSARSSARKKSTEYICRLLSITTAVQPTGKQAFNAVGKWVAKHPSVEAR